MKVRSSSKARLSLALTVALMLAGVGFADQVRVAASSAPQVGVPQILWQRSGPPPAAPTNAPSPDELTNDLLFHGGAVEHNPKVIVVFWGPQWQSGFTQTSSISGLTYTNKQAINYVQQFFTGIGGTKYNGLQTQFCDNITDLSTSCAGNPFAHYITNTAKVLRNVWVDPSPVPAAIVTSGLAEQLTEDPIAQEAMKAATRFDPNSIDPDMTVFVYTPPGTVAT